MHFKILNLDKQRKKKKTITMKQNKIREFKEEIREEVNCTICFEQYVSPKFYLLVVILFVWLV